MIIFARFGEDDLRLSRGGEIVQRNNQIPAVHLPLVDLLRTMIEAGRITQANRVRCCEHAEPAIWTDDAVLIEERHLPVCFQYERSEEQTSELHTLKRIS